MKANAINEDAGEYKKMNAIILLLPLLLLVTPAIAHVTNEPGRYNAGFLQGVSGTELKIHHTQEFMDITMHHTLDITMY
jgi:N12 class adenine-specific DNA methylase